MIRAWKAYGLSGIAETGAAGAPAMLTGGAPVSPSGDGVPGTAGGVTGGAVTGTSDAGCVPCCAIHSCRFASLVAMSPCPSGDASVGMAADLDGPGGMAAT